MSLKKQMLKNTLIYFVGSAMTLIVSIVFLPIYTKHILSDNYGYYELMKSFIELIVPVICIEIWSGILRFGTRDSSKGNVQSLFTTASIFSLGIIILFIVGTSIINEFFSIRDCYLFIISVSFEIIVKLFQYFSRTLKKNQVFVISGIISSAMNILTGCLCVFVFHLQEESMFLALIFAHLSQIIFIGIAVNVPKYFSVKSFSAKMLIQLIKFCVPLGIASVCFYLSRDFLKLLVEQTLGLDQVAFYSVALKFAALVNIIANVLQMSWTETIYGINDEVARRDVISLFVNKSAIVSCFFAVMLIPAIFLVYPILISDSYSGARNLIPFLYFSTFFQVNGSFLIGSNNSFNKSLITMISRLVAALVNVSIYLVFYKYLGLLAASISYSLGIMSEYLFSFFYNKCKLKIKLSFLPMILFLGLYFVSCLVFFTYLGLNILLAVVFCVLFISFFVKNNKKKISKYINVVESKYTNCNI